MTSSKAAFLRYNKSRLRLFPPLSAGESQALIAGFLAFHPKARAEDPFETVRVQKSHVNWGCLMFVCTTASGLDVVCTQ